MNWFKEDPENTLKKWFPNLAQYIGEFEIASKVDRFVTHYYHTTPPKIPGVIVIGDSFQSANPATGTGLSKLLTEAELLCTEFLPKWLKNGSCSLDELQEYYQHEQKVDVDVSSLERWRVFTGSLKRRRWVVWSNRLKRYSRSPKKSARKLLRRLTTI